MLTATTNYLSDLVERIGRSGIFLANGLWKIIVPPYQIFPIIKQLHFIGARSLLVIFVSGGFVGLFLVCVLDCEFPGANDA